METAAIAEVLSGRKGLGKAIRKPDDLANLISGGLACRYGHSPCPEASYRQQRVVPEIRHPAGTLTRRLSQRQHSMVHRGAGLRTVAGGGVGLLS
jgi:hypothetical protein